MKCVNCKHWIKNTNWEYSKDYGICKLPDPIMCGPVEPGGRCGGEIETREDFGCVLFEDKNV
jgi:hypothetical protein